jgi:hypothetical protein
MGTCFGLDMSLRGPEDLTAPATAPSRAESWRARFALRNAAERKG